MAILLSLNLKNQNASDETNQDQIWHLLMMGARKSFSTIQDQVWQWGGGGVVEELLINRAHSNSRSCGEKLN
jgi:hypothetical protein